MIYKISGDKLKADNCDKKWLYKELSPNIVLLCHYAQLWYIEYYNKSVLIDLWMPGMS